MEPDGRDRGALLTVLTTEHFTLQGARSGTITESLGRTTIYLGSLSASLVALALVVQGGSAVDDFRLFALVILPALICLGSVTFVRIVETGIEDAIYALAINRIRHYYIEFAGDDARYFVLGGHDDMQGALANMGLSPSRWRPFFSIASVIALSTAWWPAPSLGLRSTSSPPARSLSSQAGACRSCSDRPLSARLGPLRPCDGELHAAVPLPLTSPVRVLSSRTREPG